MISLEVPSGLAAGSAYINYAHKYYMDMSDYKPGEDMFAMINNGQNVNIGLRAGFDGGFDTKFTYTSFMKEKAKGIRYTFTIPSTIIRVMAGTDYFIFEKPEDNSEVQNFLYYAALQNMEGDGNFSFALNGFYDGHYKNFGMGVGVSLKFNDWLRVIGEMYPVIHVSDDTGQGPNGIYFTGVKINTAGHQFVIFAGNSTNFSRRELIRGTESNDVNMGFNIQRIIYY